MKLVVEGLLPGVTLRYGNAKIVAGTMLVLSIVTYVVIYVQGRT